MNAKELMDVIGEISNENIVKYAKIQRSIGKEQRIKEVNTMKKLGIWLSAAAAALVLGIGVFAVSHFVKNPGTEHNVSIPTADPTETASPADPTQPAQAATCSILEVMNPQLAVSHFDHKNEISETTIVSVDAAKQNSTKTVEFMGKEYNLIYKQTIKYLISDTTVDQFSVAGNTADSLLLLPDGTVYAVLLSPVTTLDIDEHADKETVRAAVEAALGDEIDFTGFEFCDIEGSLEDTSEGFGLYTLRWYNKKHDIMTGEIVQVSVRQSGEVGSIWMKNRVVLDLDELPEGFCVEDYSSEIESKLREIYGEAMEDYEIMNVVLTYYDSRPCLDVTVGVSCLDLNGNALSEACELAVIING